MTKFWKTYMKKLEAEQRKLLLVFPFYNSLLLQCFSFWRDSRYVYMFLVIFVTELTFNGTINLRY